MSQAWLLSPLLGRNEVVSGHGLAGTKRPIIHEPSMGLKFEHGSLEQERPYISFAIPSSSKPTAAFTCDYIPVAPSRNLSQRRPGPIKAESIPARTISDPSAWVLIF